MYIYIIIIIIIIIIIKRYIHIYTCGWPSASGQGSRDRLGTHADQSLKPKPAT